MHLDRTDEQILILLQENARLSNKQLASMVGVAPSTCLERVRRLERDGVLCGYHATVDPAAFGIGLRALVSVRLSKHDTAIVEVFREHVLSLRSVQEVYHVAGTNDFIIHVAVENSDQLRNLLLSEFTGRSEVEHLETSLIFDYHRNPVLSRSKRSSV